MAYTRLAYKSKYTKSQKAKARDRADEWFSRWVRINFCHKVYDGTPVDMCYTCGSMKEAKNMQCGHWQRRGYSNTRFHPDNARPQCVKCNKWESGKPEIFERNLRLEIGDNAVDELKLLSQSIEKNDNQIFYREQAEFYRDLVNKLVKKLNIKKWW